MTTLPQDILNLIWAKLDMPSLKSVYRVNKSLLFRVKTYVKNKECEYAFQVLKAVQQGITHYLKFHKHHPKYVLDAFDEGYDLIYDKGFHRAYCFNDIFTNQSLPTEFKLFAVYCLLNEKNGKLLKRDVRKSLQREINFNVLRPIIFDKYPINEYYLKLIQDKFLREIHYQGNFHSQVRNEYDGNLKLNWDLKLYTSFCEWVNNAKFKVAIERIVLPTTVKSLFG